MRGVGLVLLGLLLSLFAWGPALDVHPVTQGGDGQFFYKMMEAMRISVQRWRELPLWNPYECGGVPLWDNPQSIAVAPASWLSFLIGTPRAMQAWYVLHSLVGFLGTYVFARKQVELTRISSIVTAGAWTFCGANTWHLTGGHTVWAPFLYAGLALHLWRSAETRLRHAILLGLLFAWIMHEGGIYSLPHISVMLIAETFTRMWPWRRALRIVVSGVVMGATALLAGATRFLPVIYQLRSHTRSIKDADAMQWTTLKEIFLARDHSWGVAGQSYVWPEYCGYIGPFILAFALVGVFLAIAGKKRTWLVALLAVELALMMGHNGKYAPWSILNGHLFPFKEMRVPSRFVVEVTLLLATLAGVCIDELPGVLARLGATAPIAKVRAYADSRRAALVRASSALRVGLVILGFVAIGDILGADQVETVKRWNAAPMAPTIQASTRLHLGGANLAGFLDQPRQNRGRLECWEEWAFMWGAPVWVGDVEQAKPGSAGVVVLNVDRTQNSFKMNVEASEPGKVLINSNYDEGWRTNVGTLIQQDKLLVLEVPAGRHRVLVKYWPRGLTLGFILTGTLAVLLALFFFFGGEARVHRLVGARLGYVADD